MACRSVVALACALWLAACGDGILRARPVSATAASYDMNVRAIVATPAAIGPALDMAEARTDGAFAGGAAPAGQDNAHGSQGEAARGTLVWSGAVPSDATALVVPVIAGAAFRAQRVIVRVDGAVVGRLTPRACLDWTLWRVQLAPSSRPRRLEIVAKDDGDEADAWLALGAPRIAYDHAP